MKIKTIDINARESFDKINGNSYFAGEVIVNFGMKSQKTYRMPFQYGYGEQYTQAAAKVLGIDESLRLYCLDNGIILRANKITGCKKKELQS
jgi:hypothetical protein